MNTWQRNCASLDMDFVHDRYYINHNTTCDGTVGTYYTAGSGNTGVQNFITGTGATFTRSSIGTYFNSAGVLQTAAANVPRLDYGPTGGNYPLGILIEEGRTNSIRNNTMVGAIAGTPGTLPTDWNQAGFASGVGYQITGVGTTKGINYIDIAFSGTATSNGYPNILFETTSAIAASMGQTWTNSVYMAVTSGFAPSINVAWYEINSSGTVLSPTDQSAGKTVTSNLSRYMFSTALSQSTVAYVRPLVFFAIISGASYNFTLRIGLPQLELGAFPTSVIPTSGSAITRATESFTLPTTAAGGSGWYNPGVGTLLASGIFPYSSTLEYLGLASLYGGSNNSINLYLSGNSLKPSATVYAAGTLQCSFQPAPAYVVGNQLKEGISFATNNANAAMNGVTGTVCASATMPTVTTLEVGAETGNFYGAKYVQRVTYFPARQGDASLPGYTQ